MILIAEAGGTKTDWCVIDRNAAEPLVLKFRSDGINMASMDEELLVSRLESAASGLAVYGYSVEEVHFFGAGIVGGPVKLYAERMVARFFPKAEIHCASDSVAAAIALFGRDRGIAVILGTGSNCCLFDGEDAIQPVRSGGFILGDEGSAATLGRLFIADYIKEIVPPDVSAALEADMGRKLGYDEIVANVYKSPAPAAYLSGFASFVFEHLDNPYCEGLVRRNIEDFITRILVRYDTESLPVGVVGTYGKFCRPYLEEIGSRYGIHFTKFITSPMEELVKFYV